MGGSLSFCLDLIENGHHIYQRKKRKQFNTVELKIKIDCDGCELKFKKLFSNMKGVETVEISRKQSMVTVSGFVEPHKVLKRAQSTGKKAEYWPYVAYNLVTYPYDTQIYDKKAPAGFVRDTGESVTSGDVPRQEEKLATLFSDDNPHACSIM